MYFLNQGKKSNSRNKLIKSNKYLFVYCSSYKSSTCTKKNTTNNNNNNNDD